MLRNKSFLALLALAFLVRALVPVGFMPDFSGKHMIQICSGTEILSILVNDDGSKADPFSDDSSTTKKAPCPFSFLSAAIDGPPVHVPSVEFPVLVSVVTSPAVQVLDTHRLLRAPQSRAPPSLIA